MPLYTIVVSKSCKGNGNLMILPGQPSRIEDKLHFLLVHKEIFKTTFY